MMEQQTGTRPSTPAGAGASLPPSELPQVLLVDDQPARLLTYEAILEGVGVRCVRALSGAEALQWLLKQTFAVIVLDVSMPTMNGFETARLIREHPRCESLPIIFVTGVHVSDLDQLRGYEVGAIDYIAVPIVPEILRSKVALLAELYQRRRALESLNQELQTARAQLEAEQHLLDQKHRALLKEEERRYHTLFDAAQAEKEWLKAVLNSMTEEVYFADTEGRYTYANPAALREFGHETVQNSKVQDIVHSMEVFRADGTRRPIAEAPPLRALLGEEIRGEEHIVRTPRTGELRHRQVSAAPVRNAAGAIIGSVSVVRDVTEQHRADAELRRREARSIALLRLADQLRSVETAEESIRFAVELLASTLNLTRCGYGTVNADAEQFTLDYECTAANVVPMAPVLYFRHFGSYIEDLKGGRTVVCADALLDERTASHAQSAVNVQARAFVNVPIVEAGRLVAVMFVTDVQPRAWLAEDVAFIRDVADRAHLAMERRRREQSAAADLRLTTLLRNVAARMIGEEDVQSLFGEILDAAMTIAQAPAGTLQLLQDGNVLTFAATRGLSPQLLEHFERVDAGSTSSCGQALAGATAAYVDFAAAESDLTAQLHLEHGIRAAASSPLVSRSGRLIGMFTTHWTSSHQPTARERRFTDLLARQAADLVERVQAEQQLRQADRAKDEFIAILAHELRNPMVPIRAGVDVLKRARERPDVTEKVLPMMDRQIRHMVRLIDDLLDVSRIRSGKITLKPEPVSLETLVATAVDANRSVLENSGVTLNLQVEQPQWHLQVDATRISQVISNVLQNAIKFSIRGATVWLTARIERSNQSTPVATFTVRDEGAGISEAMLPRVFDLFAQEGGQEGRGQAAGLGVGLAVARRLTEMHGGTIMAVSPGVGKGSTFTVRLPAQLTRGSRNVESGRTSLAGVRVLVVDDNQDAAAAVQLLLESAGAVASMTHDGLSAIDEVRRGSYDVALVDIGMPGLDGYETCRRIRAELGDRVRLIAISGWGQQRDKDRAVASGFDVHLTKPLDQALLELAITSLL